MDRPFWYYGPVLRDTDLLNAARFPMVGLAKLSEAVLGTQTTVSGFAISATSPASMSLTLGPGQIYEQENLEATQWAAFGVDTHVIVKQGIVLDPQSLTFVAPTTTGQAQNILVQAQYADVDGGSTVLPYYNAANPSVPFSGPANAGTAQNTVRQGVVVIGQKAGVVAASGSQVTPTPDAGWVGLYVITLSAGQTQITAGNIVAYNSGQSFIPVTLPGVPAAVQAGSWVYGVDTGGADNYAVTLSPPLAGLTAGMRFFVKFVHTNATTTPVINVNSLGNVSLLKGNGSAPSVGDIPTNGWKEVFYDGAAVRFSGLLASDVVALIAASLTTSTSSIALLLKVRLQANTNFYVNASTGSDANAGTLASPWATIQHALDTVAANYDLNGFSVYIQLADGSYTAAVATKPWVGGGPRNVNIVGDVATPANVTITNTTTANRGALGASGTGVGFCISGATLINAQAISGGTGNLYSDQNALITINGPVIFGSAYQAHMYATNGGIIIVGNSYSVTAGGVEHLCSAGGKITFNPGVTIVVTITTAITFSTSFVLVTDLGSVVFTTTVSFSGSSVSGPRYIASVNGIIDSQGQGTSYLPGSSAGSTVSGGQYA